VKNVAIGVGVILGIAVLVYLFATFIEGLAPKGEVDRAAIEPFNDPKDHSPRQPVLPRGPHIDEFINNCTACHSTRLTMTQPPFPKEKWAEVVHKMVVTYGAKITPEVEAQIVKYLSAVRGT
jgi:hypothetical protein